MSEFYPSRQELSNREGSPQFWFALSTVLRVVNGQLKMLNMGLRKFWPDLEILEAFMGLNVSFLHVICISESQFFSLPTGL